jgi:hypothetical protein
MQLQLRFTAPAANFSARIAQIQAGMEIVSPFCLKINTIKVSQLRRAVWREPIAAIAAISS